MGFDQPPADGHAQAGSLGLGRVKRFEDPPLLLRGQARAVVADDNLRGRSAVERRPARCGRRSRTGSRQAASEFSKMLRKTLSMASRSTAHGRMLREQRKLDRAGRPGRFQVPPGLAHDMVQTDEFAVQHDRRRVVADLFVEMVQAVLGGLHAVQEVERLGAILDFQGQHLQAGLDALHGVAVFVGQSRDHFANGRQPLGLPLRRHVAVSSPRVRPCGHRKPRGRRYARRSVRP